MLWNLLPKYLCPYPLLPNSAVNLGHYNLGLLQYHLVLYSVLQPLYIVQLASSFKIYPQRWNSCWKPFNYSQDKDFQTWLVASAMISKRGLQTLHLASVYLFSFTSYFPDHPFPYTPHTWTMSKYSICSLPNIPMSSLASGLLHKLVGLGAPPV